MLDRAWRLQYPGVDYTWGGDDPADRFKRNLGRTTNRQAPERSDVNLTTEDTERARTDGIRFGQDYRGGVTWTFNLGMRGRTRLEAEQLLAAAEKAWRGDSIRRTPNSMATLTTLVNGQERLMYGRPRRFAPNYDALAACEASAVCTFETADDVWFGPEESVRIDLAPTQTAGAPFPLAFPLAFGQPGVQAGGIVVAGNLPAWGVAEIHGPLTNPVVRRSTGWRMQLATAVLTGKTVTLDARPWKRDILDTGGASLAGTLARASRLSQMSLDPGAHQIVLEGTDPTGAAYMIFKWRPAYAGRA